MLKAFARQSNELNSKENMIETTYYGTLSALKEIANELLCERGEVDEQSRSNRMLNRVLDCFCSERNILHDSARLIAAVALKLSQEVIDCIGTIVNEENSKLAVARGKSKNRGPKHSQDRLERHVQVFLKNSNVTFEFSASFSTVGRHRRGSEEHTVETATQSDFSGELQGCAAWRSGGSGEEVHGGQA